MFPFSLCLLVGIAYLCTEMGEAMPCDRADMGEVRRAHTLLNRNTMVPISVVNCSVHLSCGYVTFRSCSGGSSVHVFTSLLNHILDCRWITRFGRVEARREGYVEWGLR